MTQHPQTRQHAGSRQQLTLAHLALLISVISPGASILWQAAGKDRDLASVQLTLKDLTDKVNTLQIAVGQITGVQQRVSTLETAVGTTTASLNELKNQVVRTDTKVDVNMQATKEIRDDVKLLLTARDKE